MVKQKITWLFVKNNIEEEFLSKEEAEKAEEKYNLEQEVKRLTIIFRKYFKTHHEDNLFQKYLYLCVGCGKKLQEYDVESDGHRNSVGRTLHREKDISYFFGGQRCKDCDKKARELFVEMAEFYSKHRGYVTVVHIDSWSVPWITLEKADKETFLKILKIVEYYDIKFIEAKKTL